MKALIFDFDGCLVLNREKTAVAYQIAFKSVIKKDVPLQQIAKHLSPSVSRLPKAMGYDEKTSRKVAEFAFDWYNEHTTSDQLVPGVRRFLEKARERYALAVVSMNKRPHLDRVIKEFGLPVRVVVTIDDILEPRPHPEGLELALELLGVLPKDACVFGDTPNDIRAAKTAGCRAIGVLTGVGTEKQLREAGADDVLDSVTDFGLQKD